MKPTEHTFALHTEFITLGQVLKAAGIADSGTDAKAMLEEGGIRVNSAEDSRRGRKLYPGDVVTFPDGTSLTLTS